MQKLKKIIIYTILLAILAIISNNMEVEAHGGNISGYADMNSDKIVKYDGNYYGYHNEDGVRHYHMVEWNGEKWEIVMSAVYYDENYKKMDMQIETNTKYEVELSACVDGDTAKFIINNEIVTCRFLGIDTPETVHPTLGEEPYGKEASNLTKERLENATKIEIEYQNEESKTDQYDRHLVWVFVDGEILQEELVSLGYAQTYMLAATYTYAGVLQEAEYNAKKSNLGIWSDEEYITSTDDIQVEDVTDNVNNSHENITLSDEEMYISIGAAILAVIAYIIKISKKTKKKKR